jgi:type I restriction enzyme M protein
MSNLQEFKSDIDKLWNEFWSGGIANPLSVIEQISFLMFARMLDIKETREEKKASRTGKPFRRVFAEGPFADENRQRLLDGVATSEQNLRWSNFRHLSGENMLRVVRDGVFPHFKTVSLDGAAIGEYMKDAQLLIQKPSLLSSAVSIIDQLPLTEGDTKGDLYEYMLGKLSTAGIAGQFRTPRHIIRKMVEIVDPQPNQTICDPACGTAGFLVQTMLYLQEKYSSEEMIYTDESGGKVFPGDLLDAYREHIQTELLTGFDFDATMLRIAAMNLLLHNIDSPNIHYTDTLSNRLVERFPKLAEDHFDVILANPPFKGSLDEEDVHPSLLKKVKTKKTELLFLALILKMLKVGGRSATIIPDGVLFGSSKAHVALRQLLVEDNQLEAVISLPSGVFKPYAGVSTAILVFTKGGKTREVFFYDVQQDGYSLDDKRTKLSDEQNDLPDLLERWEHREAEDNHDRTQKHFFVQVEEIRGNKYDLSLNRYKETVYEEEHYDPPQEILDRMLGLEQQITNDLNTLRGMLG